MIGHGLYAVLTYVWRPGVAFVSLVQIMRLHIYLFPFLSVRHAPRKS